MNSRTENNTNMKNLGNVLAAEQAQWIVKNIFFRLSIGEMKEGWTWKDRYARSEVKGEEQIQPLGKQ